MAARFLNTWKNSNALKATQGSSTPGETVLPPMQVNVLVNYAGSNYEYTFWAHWSGV